MTGSKPGEIFDQITNLLEDFENEDGHLTSVEKSNINSENSTDAGVRRTKSLKDKAREVKSLNSTASTMGSGIINRSNSLKDKSSKGARTSHTRLVILEFFLDF